MDQALSVGSDAEDDALRILCDLPFGEGAALALGGNHGLEFFMNTVPRLVHDNYLVGFVAHSWADAR